MLKVNRRSALLAGGGSAGLVGTLAFACAPRADGGVEHAVKEGMRHSVSVRDFGALGDGTGATVAEWLTGAAHDRGYGDLRAIQSDYPFVGSLNWTIDQTALRAAMEYADARDAAVFCPAGTYVVDVAEKDPFTPKSEQLFFLYGEGPATVLKRKDRSQNSNHQRILYLIVRNGPCRFVGFHNLMFDGNARNNPPLWQSGEQVAAGAFRRTSEGHVYSYSAPGIIGETAPNSTAGSISDGSARAAFVDTIAGVRGRTGFWWEHSHAVLVRVEESASVETVLFSNIWCRDPVADNLACVPDYSGSSHRVRTLIYNNISCVDRNRSRADIIFGGYVEQVFIANAHCERLEFEESRPSPGRGIRNLTNIRAEVLDLAGHDDTGHLTFVNANNVWANWTALANMTCRFTNSMLRLRHGQSEDTARWVRIHRGTFTDCVLRLPYQAETNTSMGLGFLYWPNDGEMRHHCTFERCHFEIDADSSITEPRGYLIRGFSAVPETVRDERILELVECTFDPRIERTIFANNYGTLITRRCRFAAREQAVELRAVAGNRTEWFSYHDDFTAVAGASKILVGNATGSMRVHLYHEGIEDADAAFSTGSSSWDRAEFRSARLRWIDQGPPSGGGIAGDIARLKAPVGGAPFEWICIDTDPTSATWKELRIVTP
jgi:hypothetical protein